jgi:hypothetical protein
MGFALPGPGPFFLYAHTHTPLLLLFIGPFISSCELRRGGDSSMICSNTPVDGIVPDTFVCSIRSAIPYS